MITTLLLLAPPAEAPRVAYVARFYKPGKAVSRPQVYIDDFRGKKRRQLTFGNAEPSKVRWVGKNTLAWLEQTGDQETLIRFDLRKGRRTELAEGQVMDHSEERMLSRVEASFFVGAQQWWGAKDNVTRRVPPSSAYRVAGGDGYKNPAIPGAERDRYRYWLPSGRKIRLQGLDDGASAVSEGVSISILTE